MDDRGLIADIEALIVPVYAEGHQGDDRDGVLIDNHRVMHGRTAFDPSLGPHIRLCHVPRDEFHGRLRELSRTLRPEQHDIYLPQGSQVV